MSKMELINIGKTYHSKYEEKEFSLKNINIEVHSGELLSILGPSGCGKTTILKIIGAIIEPDIGKLVFDGEDITKVPSEKRKFAMVSQSPLLFPNMNVLENVEFGLKMQGIKKNERVIEAMNILSKMGLEGFDKRSSSQLSGGQSQRVSIARALVTKPRVLLMDEPFSSLNEELRDEMRKLIYDIHREKDIIVIFVTHDRNEAEMLSDRIITMDDGKILDIKKIT